MDQASKIYITSYEKGVVKDANTENSSEGNSVFHLQNFRITQDSTSQLGGLTNVKGNALIATLFTPNETVIGCVEIRDTIVLCTADTDGVGGNGYIYTLKIAKDSLTLEEPLTLIYSSPELLFSKDRILEMHSIYETPSIQRIYFSDYNQPTRGFNLPDLQFGTPIQYLNLFPSQSLHAPIINDIRQGGSLNVGVYEYFYWLTTKDGKDTLLSLNSKQIHLTDKLESSSNTAGYFGTVSFNSDGTPHNSGKAVEVKVDLNSVPIGIYKYINFGVIHRNVLGGISFIQKFDTKEIVDLIITSTHSGNEALIDLDPEWYQANSFIFDTNKTFSDTDGILFFGNVKSTYLDLKNWNTKALRWRNNGSIEPYSDIYDQWTNPYNDESGKAFNNRPTGTYSDWATQDQFKYQRDGSTLGGETEDGFIKYKFKLVEHKGDEAVINGGNSPTTYYANRSETTLVQNNISYPNNAYQSEASPYVRSQLLGYKRGEIYRFGLVGMKNGKTSFVKYIDDIKFPEIGTEAGYETIPGTGITNFPVSRQVGSEVKFYSLGLEFQITIPTSVQSQIDSYFFVRVPRTLENRTRLTSGVIHKWFERQNTVGSNEWLPVAYIENIENYFAGNSDWENLGNSDYLEWGNLQQNLVGNKSLVSLYSPETSYNLEYPSGIVNDYLKVTGLITDTTKSNRDNVINSTGNVATITSRWGMPYGRFITSSSNKVYLDLSQYIGTGDYNTDGYTEILTKGRTTIAPPDMYNSVHKQKIKNKDRITKFWGGDNPPTFEGKKIRNYSFNWKNNQTTQGGAYNGTNMLMALENSNPFYLDDYLNGGVPTAPYKGYRDSAFYIDYVRDIINQYGGIGENALSFNTWIQCSELMTLDASPKEVMSGDIFICYYEFMKHYWDLDQPNNQSRFEVVMFPVETVLNLNLNFGTSFTRNTGRTSDYWKSQEEGNPNGSIFQYNPVYSQESLSRVFFTKPIKFTEEENFDYRVYYSDSKIIGEELDSWAKINPNNFIDVKGAYGPINRLIEFKDTIYYFQDRGVGYLSVNPVATITSNEGQSTQLGTGEGVQDYIYISTESGSIHQFGMMSTEKGIYFFDGINRKLKAVSEDMTSISDILGIDGWIKEITLDSKILLTKDSGGDRLIASSDRCGAVLGWDKENNEIYFTLKGINKGIGNTETTIIYNESRNIIEGVFTTRPGLYITDGNHLLNSFNDKIYIYNRGNRGEFESTYSPSTVEFIVSGDPLINKILKYQEYSLTLKNPLGNYINGVGLHKMEISNDYQFSEEVDIVQKERFRKFQVKVPRDKNSPNQLARFRGDWFKCKYIWNNSFLNSELNLERFLTAVQIQPK